MLQLLVELVRFLGMKGRKHMKLNIHHIHRTTATFTTTGMETSFSNKK
jgi:hypothetical protein